MENFIKEKGNKIDKILIYFSTIKYLKVNQVYWQIINRLRVKKNIDKAVNHSIDYDLLKFKYFFPSKKCLFSYNRFCFLNQSHTFSKEIDWDFMGLGKLWNYNLEYFNYLSQEDLSRDEKLKLLYLFYDFSITNKRTLEPYPISLRTINIIKFLSQANAKDDKVLNYLYHEVNFLSRNLEYHILGNHLLENAFALCLGGAFFKNNQWLDKGVRILTTELNEQILGDGAHFELSPMYHKIIFFRILELIDWYSNYDQCQDSFLEFCRRKALLMLGWLENISFSNGDIPLFNDSAKEIAYETNKLVEYAAQLGIRRANIDLGDSGYRSFANENYEIKIDFAQIGASYQPGHAHSDALSFILHYSDKPLFVEQGTSTYNIGKRRDLERSTEAHNTVVIAGKNQSEVWGGFRVGKRAMTSILKDEKNYLEAQHDGYKGIGGIHKRSFDFAEESVQIKDILSKSVYGNAYVHLHPDRKLFKRSKNYFVIDDLIELSFEGAKKITLEDYEYAESYNLYRQAKRLVISFERELLTAIYFKRLL